jgi:hypothetical protein
MSTIEQPIELEVPIQTAFGGTRHEWDGIKEKLGDALGISDRRVKADLERFKDLIESRGRGSGAWRGQVPRES